MGSMEIIEDTAPSKGEIYYIEGKSVNVFNATELMANVVRFPESRSSTLRRLSVKMDLSVLCSIKDL